MKNSKINTALRVSLTILIDSVIILFLLEVFILAYSFSYKTFADIPYRSNATRIVDIKIKNNMSTKEIVSLLKEKEVIDNEYSMLIYIKFSKYDGKLKSGEYELCASMKKTEILDILSRSEDNSNGED